MRDIASAAGVPVSAVALALADKPGVSAARRAAVFEAADALGYQRAIQPTRPTFGLVMEEPSPAARSEGFIDTLLQGVYTAARDMDIQVVLGMHQSQSDPIDELATLAGRQLSGLILANGGDLTPEVIGQILDSGLPSVLLENRLGNLIPSVSADNFTAGRESTKHLIDLGHRRIGLIQGSERYASLHDRYRGYVVALLEAGLAVDPSLIAPQPAQLALKGYDQALQLLDLPDAPTAIYAVSDRSAAGAAAAIAERGLRIGRDVSLVGTDNLDSSAYSIPPLTTFDTSSRSLGTIALRSLLALVDGQTTVTHTVVSGSLVVRGSTAPPSA
ncbi:MULTISPECIES: LacI family DNA-binding transcriptional regulator [Plantibacter]|uniref:LacI family DNA-binding transcriptional regulator n=1 Tax=Plantibacter TaxID=190323 RepID=UPI001375986D|nr:MULTISPECIES: LacI family DNA-binding transcriptional regulator [Plantibacter]MBD8103902.1 LacI family DNA-binding transcriptional regulator [Plantibacter sp. CFBP 8775]MBD8467350.1 LacI family DNA-binding transcriptional regulator [Plantibacter sp. CFBP 8798]